MVIDLKTGDQKYFNDYASVHQVFYQLKYGLYQIVTDDSASDATARVTVQSLLETELFLQISWQQQTILFQKYFLHLYLVMSPKKESV